MPAEDMGENYIKLQGDLERSLPGASLSDEQIGIVKTALRFGYAAAYCARTHDMNEHFSQAERYKRGFQNMLIFVEKARRVAGH